MADSLSSNLIFTNFNLCYIKIFFEKLEQYSFDSFSLLRNMIESRAKWRERRISSFIKSTENQIDFLVSKKNPTSKKLLNNDIVTAIKKKKFNLMNKSFQKQIIQFDNKQNDDWNNNIIIKDEFIDFMDSNLYDKQNNLNKFHSNGEIIQVSNKQPKSAEISFENLFISSVVIEKEQNSKDRLDQNNSNIYNHETRPKIKITRNPYCFQRPGSDNKSKYMTSKESNKNNAIERGARFSLKSIRILLKSPNPTLCETPRAKSRAGDSSCLTSTQINFDNLGNNSRIMESEREKMRINQNFIIEKNNEINKSINGYSTFHHDIKLLNSLILRKSGKVLPHSEERVKDIRKSKNHSAITNFNQNICKKINSNCHFNIIDKNIDKNNMIICNNERRNSNQNAHENNVKNQKDTTDILYLKLMGEIPKKTQKEPEKSRLFQYNVNKIIRGRKLSLKYDSSMKRNSA